MGCVPAAGRNALVIVGLNKQMRNLRNGYIALAVTGLICVNLCGCSNSKNDPTASAPISTDDQIKKIQNDPGIPQAQKDQLIATIQSHAKSAAPPPSGQ